MAPSCQFVCSSPRGQKRLLPVDGRKEVAGMPHSNRTSCFFGFLLLLHPIIVENQPQDVTKRYFGGPAGGLTHRNAFAFKIHDNPETNHRIRNRESYLHVGWAVGGSERNARQWLQLLLLRSKSMVGFTDIALTQAKVTLLQGSRAELTRSNRHKRDRS